MEIPGNAQEYPIINKIPNRIFQHSYRTRTRPLLDFFSIPDLNPPDIEKKPTRWALLQTPALDRVNNGAGTVGKKRRRR